MFPRIHHIALDNSSSRSNVYSRHEPGQSNFASSASSMVTKIVSSNDGLHETCIGAQVDDSKIIWKICESLFVFSQQVSPRLGIGHKWVCCGRQICRCDHGLCLVLRNKSLHACRTVRNPRGQFFTQNRYCSENTELIDGNNNAKNPFNSLIDHHRSEKTSFHLLCFSKFLVPKHLFHGTREVRFR